MLVKDDIVKGNYQRYFYASEINKIELSILLISQRLRKQKRLC